MGYWGIPTTYSLPQIFELICSLPLLEDLTIVNDDKEEANDDEEFIFPPTASLTR